MMPGHPVTPPPHGIALMPRRFRFSCWLVASITIAFGFTSQTVLADNECGPVPASGGKIVCNAESYDPAADGNIVYRLGWDGSQPIPEPNDYTIEFRDLKGDKGIVINDGDAPHDYFPSRPNGIWIEHHGPGNLSVLASGIELTTTGEETDADERGFNFTLYAGNADISTTRRDLFLKVEKSTFNTYARALTGVHVGSGDVNIDAADLQITTTGPAGHGIVGWHDANGNVNVNVKRSTITVGGAEGYGYGVAGFVWNSMKWNQVPDPGDKTLRLEIEDSDISTIGQSGVLARHRGSGRSDILIRNSRITTEALFDGFGYGIRARHSLRLHPGASSNLDVSIDLVNSQIINVNSHAIVVEREHVDSTGTNTVRVGPNSQVRSGGDGIGILTEGRSIITIEGQVVTESGAAVSIKRSVASAGASAAFVVEQAADGAGASTIRVGPNGQVRSGGDGIVTQGKSIITIEGQVVAESGTAVSNSGGDLDVVLRGDPVIEGQILNEEGYMTNVEVNGVSLVEDGQMIRRSGPTPGIYDVAVGVDDMGVQFSKETAPRAFVYESLPETLHTLNRLSTRQERGHAASPTKPFWMWAEGSRTTREPTDSTTGADWQMERWALHAGYRIPVTEDIEAGVSLHYGDASTDVSGPSDLGGGEIDTESYGMGASLTWHLENGVYLDAQGAANWYDNDLSGTARGTLKSGVDGTGWAVALEVGRRVEMSDLTVTPHARAVYSEIDSDSFVDKFDGRVSSDSDDRTMGGLGVTFEGSRGWVLAEFQREFGIGTSVDVSGASLDQQMERARMRIAMGGSMSALEGRLTLRGEFGAASDISSSAEDTEVKAGITAHMSF